MQSTLSSRFLCVTVLATVSVLLSITASSQVWTFRNGFGQDDAGGGFPDIGRAVCTDASGNVYITGKISDAAAGNTVSFGGAALVSAGDDDGFVAKFNSSGVHQWSLRFGGALLDEGGYGIVTDGTSLYVVGEANGTMTVGSSIIGYPAVGGGIDGFVMKLDAATGTTVSWVTRFGGFSSDRAQAVCLDPSGNVYISGFFKTNTANPSATFGSFTRTVQGNGSTSQDLFAAALNSSGTFLWASTGGSAGGNDNTVGSGICYVPSSNEVVVVGNYRSNGTAGSTTATYATTVPVSSVVLTNASTTTNEDFCLLEIAAATGAFVSGSGVGAGDGNEAGLGITYDAFTGDVFFAGYFTSASTTFPGNPANANPAIQDNILYGRYNPITNAYTWIKDADNGTPATAADVARSIATNGTGNVFITGNFRNTVTFPGGSNVTASSAQSDVFVAKIDVTNGNAVYATQGAGTSGTADDIGNGIATAPGDNVWITGQYASSITFSPLAALASQGGTEDILLAKLNDPPPPPATVTSVTVPTNSTYNIGTQLNFTVNWSEAVTVTGSPLISITLGTSTKQAVYISGSGTSALLFRYVVSCNDFDNNGISVGALSLNGGTIRNTAAPTINAVVTLNSVGSTAAVNVNANAPVVSAPTVTPPTCTTATGTIVVNATGNDVLEYSINNGSSYQATNIFSGLAVGSYDIVVRYSGTTCATSYSDNPVSLDAATGCLLPTSTVVTSTPNPSCSGTTVNFTATVTSNGNPVTTGTVTFTEGVTTLAANVALNSSGQASFTTSSLSVASHTITTTYNETASFATSNGSVMQMVNPIPLAPIAFLETSGTANDGIICAGSSVTLRAPGGSSSYLWNTTATTQDIIVSPGSTITYSVVLTNDLSCSNTVSATVTVIPLPVVSAPTVTPPTCATPTGTIVVNATGSGALEYALNNGIYQSSATFSGLAPGSYTISVRSQSNTSCVTNYSSPVVITAATGCCVAPVIDAPTVTQPTCALPTGKIVVIATGSGTLEYRLNTGSWQTSNSFNGLAPGSYTISVRLKNNTSCVANYSTPVVLTAATGCPACTLTCPANITVNNKSGYCGAYVNYPPATKTGSCGTGSLSYSKASGSWFPIGTTLVTVTSPSGATCTFTVKVVDNQKPDINCPSNIVVNAATNSCSKVVSYSVSVTDNCPGVTATLVPASGSVFNTGTTTVYVTATDAAGNISTSSFTVTVKETKPPVITCPVNITVNAEAGLCKAMIDPGTATATDNCPGVITITGKRSDNKALNAYYPLGVTTITWKAKDASGNESTCQQKITVKDIQPPVITNVSVNPAVLWPADHSMKTVTVNYTSTDNCGPDDNCSSGVCYLSVTSNEPISGTGNGDLSPDWQIIDAHKVKLRAERNPNGAGRIYTIKITCIDAAGNSSVQTITVSVPLTASPANKTMSPAEKTYTIAEKEISGGLTARVMPNPSEREFNLVIKGGSHETLEIRVFDITGREVQRIRNAASTVIRFGDKLMQGTYIVEIRQGKDKVVLKAIKQ